MKALIKIDQKAALIAGNEKYGELTVDLDLNSFTEEVREKLVKYLYDHVIRLTDYNRILGQHIQNYPTFKNTDDINSKVLQILDCYEENIVKIEKEKIEREKKEIERIQKAKQEMIEKINKLEFNPGKFSKKDENFYSLDGYYLAGNYDYTITKQEISEESYKKVEEFYAVREASIIEQKRIEKENEENLKKFIDMEGSEVLKLLQKHNFSNFHNQLKTELTNKFFPEFVKGAEEGKEVEYPTFEQLKIFDEYVELSKKEDSKIIQVNLEETDENDIELQLRVDIFGESFWISKLI